METQTYKTRNKWTAALLSSLGIEFLGTLSDGTSSYEYLFQDHPEIDLMVESYYQDLLQVEPKGLLRAYDNILSLNYQASLITY